MMKSQREQNQFDQSSPAGQCVIVEDSEGFIHKVYAQTESFQAKRFHRKIKSDTEWFEGVIKHAPTVGTFYENLIRNTLKEFAPSSHNIGTGFVFDSSRNRHGKQIDILIYDDSDRSVVYRSDEFVVVNPGSVISVAEIKKTLNSSNLKDVVKSTFFNNLGSHSQQIKGIQKLKIFSFTLGVSKDTICRALVNVLDECIQSLDIDIPNGSGVVPITYCVLPELYFMDEDFYVFTELVRIDGPIFSLKIRVASANTAESIGVMLQSLIKENPEKISAHEKNYFSGLFRPIPETLDVNGRFYLIDVWTMAELVNNFPGCEEVLHKLVVDGAKPVSINVPKGLNISDYKDITDFLENSGSVLEFYSVTGGFSIMTRELTM